MPRPLSNDLRQRILDASPSASDNKTAERFGVSRSTVLRLRARKRETGSIEAKPHGGGRSATLTDEDRPRFEAFLAENVSMTHAEMAARFTQHTGRAVSRQTVQRHLRRWNLTRKKR